MDRPSSDDREDRQAAGEPVSDSPEAVARRALGRALRELIEALPSTGVDEGALKAATETVHQLAARVGSATRPRPAGEFLSGMGDFLDRGPITGQANPIAPPFRMWPDWEARVARGEGRFGAAYEGGPGIAHGGFVAAALDELLGMATIFSGGPGMTGELTVRYRRPTPLHTDLTLEGRLDGQRGRRLELSGELRAGDELIAEATGLFIAVGDAKFAELDEQRRNESS